METEMNDEKLHQVRSRRDIPAWLKLEGFRVIAEIGVRGGDHLRSLLKAGPEKLVAVDLWEDDGLLAHNDSKTPPDQIRRCYEAVLKIADKYPCVDVHKGSSRQIAREFGNDSFDFIYLDADHTYSGVTSDITSWWPKIRRGGVLAGHDYVLRRNPHGVIFGVVPAVHEFVGRHALQPWFHCTWPEENPGNWFIRKPLDWGNRMTGFITLASGEKYLQMAAAFAVSAKRFGFPTILLFRHTDVSAFARHFFKVVDIGDRETVNPPGYMGCVELKKFCYEYSEEFAVCAYCDADSLVIRDPTPMFRLVDRFPIHTPGGRTLADDECWAHPPGFTVRELATHVGVNRGTPIHTLNGGFLLWRRGSDAEAWFRDFNRLFPGILSYYQSRSRRPHQVREELCMSLAFALQEIELPRSDTSIGVWDAQRLDLDIEQQEFECRKGFYWEGHEFRPCIAHFGGGAIGAKYRECVQFLETIGTLNLPLFESNETTQSPGRLGREQASFNSYSITRDEYDWLQTFIRENDIKTVIEFGPGASTWCFLEAGCEVCSLEYQEKWYRHYRKEFADNPHVTIIDYTNEPDLSIPELDSRTFDLGFVDSPVGKLGVHYKQFARINACEYVAARTDVWMLHDARRHGERNTLSLFEDKGWTIDMIESGLGIAVVRRKRPRTRAVGSARRSDGRDDRHAQREVNSRIYDFSHWEKLPKVSCQCVTYGRTNLLDEAVESFLRQDYPGEKELLILNDYGGLRIESELEEVKVVNIPYRFKTIGEKRNACVALCTGEVIFPWDDDDIHLPHRISYCLQQMKNRRYFKSDKLWYWNSGEIAPEPKEAVAHAMGCWSVEFFDQVGGYPHMQSGQDMGLEDRFRGPDRIVEKTPVEWVYYIYRFPGTGSYHLSATGYGLGFEEVAKYVDGKQIEGVHRIQPHWAQDYESLVFNQLLALRQ